MNQNSRLHHYCQNITKGRLKDIVEMYGILECEVVFTPEKNQTWLMVGQPPLRFAIQITEVSDEPIEELDKKTQTHVAFISDNPKELVEKVAEWAKGRGFKFRQGGWSDKELFFDLPEIFVNFTVEVMHTSIEEEK